MRTLFHGAGPRKSFRTSESPGRATVGNLSMILAVVVPVSMILSLAGCRSREYPRDARGPYPGDHSPYAMRGAYDPRGYPADPQRGETLDAFPDGASYWNGDHLSGSPSIRIDLRTQRAYFYKGQELAGVSRVSTGRPGYDTPAGSFRITEKSPQHRSNLYGEYVDDQGSVVKANVDKRRDEAPPGTKFRGASMPNFLRFNDAIGMHGGHLPGYPASSGCVRLPEDMASHFFANAPPGTPVMVVR